MILGIVNDDYAVVFPLTLRGVDGTEITIETRLDTGYNDYLTLPLTLITRLGFPYLIQTQATLADGSDKLVAYYGATVVIENEVRTIPAIATDHPPLAGMLLFRGYEIRFVIEISAPVTIQKHS
jgi:predicted aspartyl protease